MRYRLICLREPVLIAVSKPLLTEFGIHHRLESCVDVNVIFKKNLAFELKRCLDPNETSENFNMHRFSNEMHKFLGLSTTILARL